MSEILQLDYYYGIEAEQFSFYRVPRLLIKDERFKKLSSDAKLLYGLMLDRMSLSIKNEWFDEDNRAYIIYTIDSIMKIELQEVRKSNFKKSENRTSRSRKNRPLEVGESNLKKSENRTLIILTIIRLI